MRLLARSHRLQLAAGEALRAGETERARALVSAARALRDSPALRRLALLSRVLAGS
jgi:hypothetical protein